MRITDLPEIADRALSSEVKNRVAPNSSLGIELPSTSKLLVEGGDARIVLGSDGITNKYGCTPFPDAALLSFGSSTASVISAPAYAAANRLREKLVLASNSESAAQTYARELNRIRPELKTLCGVADMPCLDIVFAASGTDLHLIASQIAGGSDSLPTRVIMAGVEETGSCVPIALAGKHFSTRSALGQAVDEGAPIAGSNSIDISTVPIRYTDGRLRPIADIDADVESLVSEAIKMHQRILLILVDVSKTGMIAPSPACVTALHRRFPESIDVLVDACQFRIAPATLRAYLKQDFMVALTGSKFVTGPTFAGALFLPSAVAHRLRTQSLPQALSSYSARAEWPSDWHHADIFDNVANFGLLLRWEASLEELRAFRAVPEAAVCEFLEAFAHAINQYLQNSPFLEPLPVPQLDRHPLVKAETWDQYQTIFPFLLYHSAANSAKSPLNREQTQKIYRLLQADLGDGLRCQLGQPVACGTRNGIPVSALRICASARLVVEGCAQNGQNTATVIESALVALHKTVILVESDQFQK
ncbi:MAG TPA: hypothetical protein VIF82_03480 [Burkholderiaceae bacterium]|jgi:hypothetical protein